MCSGNLIGVQFELANGLRNLRTSMSYVSTKNLQHHTSSPLDETIARKLTDVIKLIADGEEIMAGGHVAKYPYFEAIVTQCCQVIGMQRTTILMQ